ncbi:uncharacterized protein RSE6_02298 [Rhynchosporium secalis]|uniref:Uncharacterized protein n=1 Tax=Rhynchosporium secalis TaxID=38038 RepID=A0A1E1LZW2_RHYSE|nr:uncharacterized protein RSE6_02298 [Rhynchosporium secalis]
MGNVNAQYPKTIAKFGYLKLSCMNGLVGDKVFALSLFAKSDDEIQGAEEGNGLFVGSIENVIDSWGPGLLLAHPGTPYGVRVYSVLIGGGSIICRESQTTQRNANDIPMYHWSRDQTLSGNEGTFNIRDPLRIGAITVQPLCPLDVDKCFKASESHLHNIGTEPDYWELTERQKVLQGGQYVVLQVGNTYHKMKGRTLKTAILDRWQMSHDFNLLCKPWGLQVSLCTGVARRVPIKKLIEEPMFAYIDRLLPNGWDSIKSDARAAFMGSIDYIQWISQLDESQRDCMIKVITFLLELLKDTGLDREGSQLQLIWPDGSSLSHVISLKCSKSNLWARVLKDSPSCATFAAITGLCLEAPGHLCKNNDSATWTGQGVLLSTAVSQVAPITSGGICMSPWELRDGQRYWMEKSGGDLWVYTTKGDNSETQLRVKINRFPIGLSLMRNWQVLRERQDLSFEAEEVVVFGAIA